MKVLLETTYGPITLTLDADKAPETVANFINYVKDGFYDGTVFHRVISNFMIQGGGFTEKMEQKPVAAPIRNEGDNGLSNETGTIAMARTSDPHSATAQFFINTVDNRALDHKHKSSSGWGYTVFGKVVKGLDVVDRIGATRTRQAALNGYPAQDVPEVPVVIKSVRRVAPADPANSTDNADPTPAEAH